MLESNPSAEAGPEAGREFAGGSSPCIWFFVIRFCDSLVGIPALGFPRKIPGVWGQSPQEGSELFRQSPWNGILLSTNRFHRGKAGKTKLTFEHVLSAAVRFRSHTGLSRSEWPYWLS